MTDEALERKKAWYMGVMIQLREWYEIKLFHTGCGIDHSFDVEAIEVLNAQKSDFEDKFGTQDTSILEPCMIVKVSEIWAAEGPTFLNIAFENFIHFFRDSSL
uniref:Uncharacterized protein n=1 Tax=Solanum tuberosum TaxID=4113 RepID=M1DBB4_SOLTU